MANNRVHVSLAFTADTKQAKQQIDQLQASLTKLTTFSGYDLKFGDNFKKEVVEASQSLAQLQTALHSAINQDTGKIDLSKFNASMKSANMTINDYVRAFKQMGPEGEKAFEQFSYAIQGAEIPLKRTGKLANELWITLKNTMRWQLSASIIQGFTGALQKAYGYAQDLNESLNNIRIVTNASVEDMARFAIEANKSAKALSATTTEYTNASLIYYQQGLSDAEVKERTDVTIKMANVSRESAETVSDQMTAVWNNFADGSKTLEYYADVMTALGAATASSTAEISTGLEKFAAVAETVGLSYEYATTALATITDTTRQSADVVGNALKTLFARIQGLSLGETLEDGTDLTKYSEALAKVGISIKEQDGSLREMDDILDDMAGRWETLNKDQQVALAQTVAGVRQYTQLVALMDNWDKFQKNLSVAQGAEGALQQQADIYAEGWEAARDRVQASLESIYHDLLNDEFFIDLNNGLAKTIGLLDQVIDNFGGLKGIVAGLGVVFTKVFNKQLVNSISNITFSLKQRVTGGANEIALKNETATAYQNWTFGVGNEEDSAKKMSQQRIGQLQKDLLEDSKYLTEEAIKQRQIDIDRQKVLDERVIASARELDIQKEITGDLRSDMSDMYRYDGSQQERQKANRLLNSTDSTMTDLTILQTFKALPAEVKNSTESLNLFKKVITETFNIDPRVLDNNLNDVDKTIQQLEKRLQNLKQQFVNRATQNLTGFADESSARASLEAHLQNQGMAQDEIEETVRNYLQFIRETRAQMEQEFDNYTNAMGKQFSQQIKTDSEEAAAAQAAAAKRAARNLDEWKQGLVGVMQGVSQVTFGIQSLIAINDVLNNQDLEWHEKTLSIIQSLAFGLPSVVNGLALLGDSFKKLKDAQLINSALVTLSKNSKIASLGLIQVNNAGTATVTSLAGLGRTILGLIGPYALLAAAVVALALAYKGFNDNTQEGKLKKLEERSKELAETLNKTKQNAEELINTFKQYDDATDALSKCTQGTDEFKNALQEANDQASKLLELYPQLYELENAVTFENGQIKIADWAQDEVKQKQNASIQANQLANNYVDAQVRAAQIEIDKEDLKQQMAAALKDSPFRAEDETLTKVINQAINTGNFNTVEGVSPVYLKYFNDLQPVLNKLIASIEGNTNAIEIENSKAIGETLANKGYSDTIIKATAKAIEQQNKKNDKTLESGKDFRLNADDYFKQYAEANNLIGAEYNRRNGTYTYQDETYELSLENLRDWIVANTVNPESLAADISKAISGLNNQSQYENLLNNGTSALSAIELYNLNSQVLEDLVDFGALEQSIVDEINNLEFDPDNITLEDTLSANLQQTFVDAFGKDWANEYAGDLIKQIPQHMRDEFAQAVAQTNWSDVDSAQGFHDLLDELGGWMPEDEIEGFIQQMMDAHNAVKNFNLEEFKTDFYDIKELISELEKGDTIKAEDYAKLTEAEKEYFTLTSDGTYMLTEDAKKFYDTVMGNRLEDAKEKITQLQGDINKLETSATRLEYYGGDINSLTSDQAGDILYQAGRLEEGMDLQERRNAVQQLIADYEEWQKTLNDTQAVLASMAEDETTLNKWLDEGKIDVEEYDKAMEVLRINQEKALKALNANVKGLEKSAPKIQKALEAMNKGLDVDSDTFINLMNEAIEAHPEFTGAIMSAYQTLLTATPGTIEYTNAFKELQQVLSETASSAILSDIGEVAESTLEVLDDELSSTSQKMNAIANLNAVIGTDIFSFEDIGTDKLQNLREALNGSESAFKELQTAVAEGILIKYNLGTGTIDVKELFTKGIEIQNLADDVREALIACGMFEIVDEIIEVPITNMDITKDIYNSMTQAQKDNMDIIDGGFERGGSVISGTKPVKISFIKPVGDAGSLRSGTSKSGGGGSKGTKKVSSDEKERYHVVNKQIEDVTAKYEEAGKEREKTFGPLKDSWAEKELGYLDQLIEKERQYKTEIEQYLATDKSALAAYGATFGEHGEITNYDALMDEQIAKYNAAIEKAGTNQEAQEAAEKAYDLFIKALENYEGTYSAYLDKLATIQDLQNEKIDKELEHIQDRLDAKLELEADQLKYLDYLIGKLDDEAFALADALVSLHDKTQPIMNQSDHYAQAWEELQQTAKENGGWTQDMIDKLRELRDGLISTNEEMMKLQKTIEEKVNEAIAECTDELDKQINRFDTYQNILQNYNDIIDLSGKKFKDYAMMLELSSLMTDNAINKLASSREKLETLGQSQVNAQAKLELAEDSGDQDVIDYWKKTLEDIQIEVENATADMTSAWKEALQSASDAFENQVNLAIDNFKGGLEAFGDLDMISDSYDRAEKAAERYLEDFEKTHELSQLGRDITKAMNDTTSAFAKDELAELMAEVNEKQKDGVKMSEYDLEVLKKKFELKQAELALEEAQNSMSQVRLTRDNEGNWSYQYTADQDKVDEALNEYETRLYEVAKLSDEYIDEMSSAIIQNQKDMYEALAGLRAEDFASYKEYEAAVRDIVNFYTSQDAYLRNELAKAVGDTEYITTAMSGHYNNLSTSFTTVVDTMLGNTGDKTGNLKTWMESTDNLAEQAEEYFNTELPKAYATWEKAVGDAMEAAGTNTEDFKDDVSGYMEDIGDASEELAGDIGNAADDMQDYIEDIMDAVWDWQEEYVEDIRKMIAANEELITSMMQVAAAQGVDNNLSSPEDESETTEETQTPDTSNTGMETKAANMASDAEELLERVHTANLGGYKADGSAGGWKTYARAAGYSEEVIGLVSKALNDSKAGGGYSYFYNKAKELLGLASGGYTGEWGPEGRLALLHQKELVLNSQDTENFLAGINILREIARMIDLQANAMASPMGFSMPFASSHNGLEQNVHIQASVPGVQDRNEIEIALRSLVNEASQFVLE